jgi:AraC-like DNA-binding protein
MHIAADLLASTDLSVAQVARRTGYDSQGVQPGVQTPDGQRAFDLAR